MTAFQWNEYHIAWFIERFKEERKEITSRVLQRNYNRRKGESKQDSQDFRNLMRLMVRNGLARVTSGCVSSNSYRIKLIDNQIKLADRPEVFDNDFFCKLEHEDILPAFDELFDMYLPLVSRDKYIELYTDFSVVIESYISAFFVYEHFGCDYDLIFDLEDSIGFPRTIGEKDFFSFAFNVFVCEYNAIKVLVNESRLRTDIELPDELNHNDAYLEMFSSGMTLGLLMEIAALSIKVQASSAAIEKSFRELADSFTHDSDYFLPNSVSKQFLNLCGSIDGNEEFTELQTSANLLWAIDSSNRSPSEEWVKVMNDLKAAHSISNGAAKVFKERILIEQNNKPPTESP